MTKYVLTFTQRTTKYDSCHLQEYVYFLIHFYTYLHCNNNTAPNVNAIYKI